MSLAVEATGLVKRFGELVAVNEVDVRIEGGIVYGLLGANGAGKTTLLKILTGMTGMDSGSGTVLGLDIQRDKMAIRESIGYMPQNAGMYGELTAMNNLRFFAQMYGVADSDIKGRRDELDVTLGLSDAWGHKVQSLPRGVRQKVAFACASLHRPKLIFLDEPSSGMDPMARVDFWDVLYALAEEGTTLIVTTHFMDEAERCDHLSMMSQGRVVASGTPASLRGKLKERVVEIETKDWKTALSALGNRYSVGLSGGRLRVTLPKDEGVDHVVQTIRELGLIDSSVSVIEPDLQDVFIAQLDLDND